MTDNKGRFGVHGGQYIPETLMNAVIELEKAYNHYKNDPEFNKELNYLLNDYAGRPSKLYFAKKMTEDLGGAKIYLKREDLTHTGAHKINNVLGQALLAKKMGKRRLIAETGAGQHGVATATAAALMGMECVVFMGEEDTIRQALNVYKMRLLGATVIPVTSGTKTLKDAVSEAMREWTSRIDDTHYCLGSVMGPHPFPTIVRDFQAVISKEIKEQILEKEGKLPDAVLDMVSAGKLSAGHARAILSAKEEKQTEIAKHVETKGLSVREAEKLSKKGLSFDRKKPGKHPTKNAAVKQIESELSSALGTKVNLSQNGNKGKIEIEYYSREELEGLIEALRAI